MSARRLLGLCAKLDRKVGQVALPEEDFEVYDAEDSESQISGVIDLFSPGRRVVDLGAGRGRIALPLAEHGVQILAVDHDEAALSHENWTEHSNLQVLREDFLSPHATWFEGKDLDGVLCLGNTLNLVQDRNRVHDVFRRAAAVLSDTGIFLIDDFPLWGPDMIRTQWPLGLSPDGDEQVVWAPGGQSFAYRTGSDVDSDRRYPDPAERLLRAWSIAELEKIAAESGFGPWKHDESALMILFAGSD
jgi:SAM-dependent methyltransferase